MAQRQTKVYQGRQEQERDEADAVAHGWRVVSRDSGPAGYKVTYELASPYATTTESKGSGGVRGITWLFLLWNLVFLILIAWRLATGDLVGGTTQQVIDAITGSRVLMALVAVWLIGLVVLAVLWFRGRSKD
jgi:hypothetical protein